MAHKGGKKTGGHSTGGKTKHVSIAAGKPCDRLKRLQQTNQSAARKYRAKLIQHYSNWYNSTVKSGYTFHDDLYEDVSTVTNNSTTTTDTTDVTDVTTTNVTDEIFVDVRVRDWVNTAHFTNTVNRAVQKKSESLVRTISELREQIEETERQYREKKSVRRSRGRSHHSHYEHEHEHEHGHGHGHYEHVSHGHVSPGHSHSHHEGGSHRCSMSRAVKNVIQSFADHSKSSVSRRGIVSAAKRQFNAALCKLELSQSACQRLSGRRSGSRKRRSVSKRHSARRSLRRSVSKRHSAKRSLRRSVRKSCGKRSVSRKCSQKRTPKYYYDYSAGCAGGQVQYHYEPSQVAQVSPSVLHTVPAVQLAANVNAKK